MIEIKCNLNLEDSFLYSFMKTVQKDNFEGFDSNLFDKTIVVRGAEYLVDKIIGYNLKKDKPDFWGLFLYVEEEKVKESLKKAGKEEVIFSHNLEGKSENIYKKLKEKWRVPGRDSVVEEMNLDKVLVKTGIYDLYRILTGGQDTYIKEFEKRMSFAKP